MENIVVKNRRILKVLQELLSENVIETYPSQKEINDHAERNQNYVNRKMNSTVCTRSKLGVYSSGPSFR